MKLKGNILRELADMVDNNECSPRGMEILSSILPDDWEDSIWSKDKRVEELESEVSVLRSMLGRVLIQTEKNNSSKKGKVVTMTPRVNKNLSKTCQHKD